MKVFGLFFFLASFSFAQVELKYLGKQELSSKLKFENQLVGGLSHLQFKDNQLFTVTDDRGRNGGARILVFNYQIDKKDWTSFFTLNKSIQVDTHKNSKILDLEAFYIFKNGKWLISSEGDLNQKPRILPFVKFWESTAKWGDSLALPEDFIAETIGLQTKGLQNNSAFEALTVSADEKKLWLFSEGSLFQSSNSAIEILEYDLENLKVLPQRFQISREKPLENSFEVFRGISDALWIADNQFLVLERYVSLKKSSRLIEADLYVVEKLGQEFKKTKLLQLTGDIAGNWEGLAILKESEDKQILVILEDNNFDSQVSTQFLFYDFKIKQAGKK